MTSREKRYSRLPPRLSCNTTFLIEGAPEAKTQKDAGATESSQAARPENAETSAEETVTFEKAQSEHPKAERFAGAVVEALRAKVNQHPAKKTTDSAPTKKTATKKATTNLNSSKSKASKRRAAIIAAVAVAFLAAVIVYLITAIVFKAVTKEDMKLIPGGEKIARILHMR